MTIHGSTQLAVPPRISLLNITVASTMWRIQDVNTQITSCNISMATFKFTSSNKNNSSSSLSVVMTKSSIGSLVIGPHFTATISSSQALGQERAGETAIAVVQASLYMTDSVFIGNNVSTGPSILYAVQSSSITIKHCVIKHNTGYYGAVFVNDSSHVSITDSVFEGNMPPHDITSTGTLTIKLHSSASIVRSNFSYNKAYEGAAVTGIHASHIDVVNSVFKGNEACQGGAITIAYGSKAIIQHALFYENAASISKSKVKHDFENINLTGNSFNIQRQHKVSMIMQENKSDLTHAKEGGFEFLSPIKCAGGAILSSDSELDTNSSMFVNNTSTDTGGAIHVYTSTLTLGNDTFDHNTAHGQGGALFVQMNCLVNIRLCSFLTNRAFQMGAISAGQNSKLLIDDSKFQRNSADQYIGAIGVVTTCSVVMTNCLFLENSALQSAAFAAQNNVSAVVTNCTFHDNMVDDFFAAIWVTYFSTVNIEKCIFTDGKGRQCTVSIDDHSIGFIADTKFTNNTALQQFFFPQQRGF